MSLVFPPIPWQFLSVEVVVIRLIYGAPQLWFGYQVGEVGWVIVKVVGIPAEYLSATFVYCALPCAISIPTSLGGVTSTEAFAKSAVVHRSQFQRLLLKP